MGVPGVGVQNGVGGGGGGGGGGGDAIVIPGGNLGAAFTLPLAGAPNVQLTGVLTANCAMTVTGMSAGCAAVLLLAQDGVGGHTLTVNGTSVPVPSAASTPLAIQLWSTDGATLQIQPGAINGVNGTVWWQGAGAPGTVTGAVTGDLYVNTTNGEVYKSTGGPSTWTDQGFSLKGASGAGGRLQQRYATLGFTDAVWDFYSSAVANLTITSQELYGTLCGFLAGDVINNIFVLVKTAGAGTKPTGLYVAVYDTAGVQHAVSANLAAGWAGPANTPYPSALAAPYTVPSNESLYLAFLQNGPWGTTQMTLGMGPTGTFDLDPIGSNPVISVKQTGQATPPAPATFVGDTSNLWLAWS